MNKSSIDQLVSQYLTSVNTFAAGTNTAPVASNIGSLTNTDTYYYPYNGSTISTNSNNATT